MTAATSATAMPRAGIGDRNVHRAVASSGGGSWPSLPLVPPGEPAGEVVTPPTPDETAADLGAAGAVELPAGFAVVFAAVEGAGAADPAALGDGDGDGGGGGGLTE